MVVQVAAVVGAVGVNHETYPQPRFRPGLVHTGLEAFYLDGVVPGSVAYFPRRPGGALRQQIADAFTAGNHLKQFQHGVLAAEFQLQAAGIPGGEQSVFKAFHGKGDYLSRGNSIQGVSIAELVAAGDGGQVINAAIRPERGEGLILRSAVSRVHAIGRFNLDYFFAADGTGITGIHPDADILHHRMGVYFFYRREEAVTEIAYRQVSDGFKAIHADTGTCFPEPPAQRPVFFQPVLQALYLLRAQFREGLLSPDGNRFQVF